MNILIVWCVIVFFVLAMCKCNTQLKGEPYMPRLYIVILILVFCFGYAASTIDHQQVGIPRGDNLK